VHDAVTARRKKMKAFSCYGWVLSMHTTVWESLARPGREERSGGATEQGWTRRMAVAWRQISIFCANGGVGPYVYA
jgi:hypothetical protein